MNSGNAALVARGLRLSVYDACAYAFMMGVGESYFIAFAISIGATAPQIGYLTTAPLLVGSVLQLLSPAALHALHSRRQLVLWAAGLQGLIYLPLAYLAFRSGTVMTASPVWILIALAVIYHSALLFLAPAWQAWMGDLLGSGDKGSYLGRRNRASGAVQFVAFFATGIILNLSAAQGRGRTAAFAVMFMLAFVARGISIAFLKNQYEPPASPSEDTQSALSLKGLAFRPGERNTAVLIAYLAMMYFSVYVSVPFFSPYMFRGLQFTYLDYTIVSAASMLAKFTMMPFWGRMCDRYGARKILLSAGSSLGLIPLLWCFIRDPMLLATAELYSSAAWAAFELSSFYYLLDAIPPERRPRLLAVYQAINGVGIFLGMNLGVLISSMGTFRGTNLLLPILVSALARLTITIGFWRYLREVRRVEEIRYDQVFLKALLWVPTTGLVYSWEYLRTTLRWLPTSVQPDRKKE
ncbi:MAG: MFS transporter [candidate division Zixibacteria bacterium]|nr:MFS transporter [candidate division Zixibacteria bacterium]